VTLTEQQIAEKIANALFTNGVGDRAFILRMHDRNDRYLGGWCKGAAIDQIRTVLALAGKENANGK
jgi:hypothetical protein